MITSLMNHQVRRVLHDQACNTHDDSDRADKKTQRANGDTHQLHGMTTNDSVFSSITNTRESTRQDHAPLCAPVCTRGKDRQKPVKKSRTEATLYQMDIRNTKKTYLPQRVSPCMLTFRTFCSATGLTVLAHLNGESAEGRGPTVCLPASLTCAPVNQ